MSQKTEAAVVADLATKVAAIDGLDPAFFVKSDDGREFLAVKEGYKATETTLPDALPLYEPHLPYFIKQSAVMQTADSLVDYVERFKTDDTVLFADIGQNLIRAQIDYHAREKAGRIAHSSSLYLAFSVEWSAWTGISGKLMEQLEFARFIEENGADVRAPSGADLLECVRDLQALRKVNFTKAVRTSSENEDFEYSDETTASSVKKGAIEVPTRFQLGIPVYFGEKDEELFAFLRWKLEEGNLKLGIQLHRAEHVRQAVFQAIVRALAERTSCPAVFGKL